MNKKLVLLPLLASLLLGGCSSSSNSNKKTMFFNDFENVSQLSLMKFPFPKHSDRGRFTLSDKHVTSGEKSLEYKNDHGSYIEMCHYFDNTLDGVIDTANIKSIELDIFNASEFDTTCTFIVYNDEDMSILLEETYSLPKDTPTHLSFTLSKVALEYNYDTMVCSSLKINTPNTDYNKGIGYTFYLDNWHAKMGSEYTEEDLINKSKIEDIKNQIDALPEPGEITLSYGDILKDIALQANTLPDLYRRAIPNFDEYRAMVEQYYVLYSTYTPIDYDSNPFISFDEFFGIAQFEVNNACKAEIRYCEEAWPTGYEDVVGSTKITFAGASDNQFVYSSNVDLNDFDFVHFRIYNKTPNYIRIWFSYTSNVFADVASGEVTTVSFASTSITDQYFWAVTHLRSAHDGTLVASSGSLYFDQVHVTGRSQETLQAEMVKAFDKIPSSVSDLVTEDDYLEAITPVRVGADLYNIVTEIPESITAEKIQLLHELDFAIKNAGYSIGYNAYSGSMKRFSSYGQDFTSSFVEDETFGFVSVAHITNDPVHSSNPDLREQAFTFAADTEIEDSVPGYIMFIYNPTDHEVNLAARTTDFSWGDPTLGDNTHLFTSMPLTPGWNKVELKTGIMSVVSDRKVALFMTCTGSSMVGDWKFSSLIGVPRAI